MKHIHFIGICGVGMGALAVLWKKKGWKVTGSDVGFYPPISTHLKNHGIEYYAGWHPDKMGQPDLVVVGNVAGSENPEWQFVRTEKIPYVSYPELIAQNLIKENSIVCAGTYGKTSTTALLAWILKNAKFNPTYMFGGLSLNLDMSADDPENSQWSIMEGDEYKTSRWDKRAKFFFYKPTHLLLTAVNWDHADIYKTEEEYLNAFRELVKMIPQNGLMVACTDNDNVNGIISYLLSPIGRDMRYEIKDTTKIISYGKNSDADYRYSEVKQTKTDLSFKIMLRDTCYVINAPIIGDYMAENICGAFALAHQIGVAPESIIKSLLEFKGLKRRLEKRGELNGADVYDDIAHSPLKAKYVLEALRNIYHTTPSPLLHKEGATPRLIAIFEPNTGNRQREAVPAYANAFAAADEVIIPRLTAIKTRVGEPKSLEGEQLAEIISKTHTNVKYLGNDEELVNYLKQKTRASDAVVFCGSHGFRGMIEKIISLRPPLRP